MTKPSLLIFDLDGTLIETSKGISAAAEAAFKEILPDYKMPSFKNQIGPPLRELFASHLPPNEPTAKINELVSSFKYHYDSDLWKISKLYNNVIEVLKIIQDQDIECWILTNKRLVPTEKLLKYHKIYGFFKKIITADSSPQNNKKEAFKEIWSNNHQSNNNIMLIGDSIDDYEISATYGFRFLGIGYGYGSAKLTDILGNQNIMISEFKQLIKHLPI